MLARGRGSGGSDGPAGNSVSPGGSCPVTRDAPTRRHVPAGNGRRPVSFSFLFPERTPSGVVMMKFVGMGEYSKALR
jgi:hypothetical protein